ncbi:Uncharacterized protein GBIM_04529 [Gryllus bimaculatus]|nr:Uncharacterized protein GBIM_04529 [Gryllus bimaculatus]
MCRCFCNCKILHARPCCVFICCTLLVICVAVGFVVVNYWPENSGKNGTDAWTCYRSSCRRCELLEEPSIQLNASMCTNITYLSEDDGYFYIVTVNESVVTNETLTDLNPLPVCIEEPTVEQYAKACLHLYDVNATNSSLHVCAHVEVTKKLHFIKKFEFGCFDIKPLKTGKPLAVVEDNTKHSVIVT